MSINIYTYGTFLDRHHGKRLKINKKLLDSLAKKTSYTWSPLYKFSKKEINYSMYLYLVNKIALDYVSVPKGLTEKEKNIYCQARIDMAVNMVDDFVSKIVISYPKQGVESIIEPDKFEYKIADKDDDLWKAKNLRCLNENRLLIPYAVSHLTAVHGLKAEKSEFCFNDQDQYKGQKIVETEPISESDLAKNMAKTLEIDLPINVKNTKKTLNNSSDKFDEFEI